MRKSFHTCSIDGYIMPMHTGPYTCSVYIRAVVYGHVAAMGAWRATQGAPRSLKGGRSSRYESRRKARRATAAYVPRWSANAAAVVMRTMKKKSAEKNMKFYEYAEHVLSHGHSVATLGIRGLTADEATTVNEVLTAHAAKMQGADAVPHNVVKAFLKPLYVKAAVAKLDELEFEIPSMHYPTLQSVLSSAKRLERDHSRTIEDNKRILKGLSHWPMDKLKRRGVVCYERALERLNTERPDWAGVPTAAFMHRLVHTDGLPTLTGGCADHYVLVSARAGPRWLTVEELARAMEIHATSSLMRGLTSRDIKPAQAGEALGNGIHGACSRAILGPLIANGTLGPGMTYGSVGRVAGVRFVLEEEPRPQG